MTGTTAGGGGAGETSASGAAALNASAEALPGVAEIGDLRACRRRAASPRKNQGTNTTTGHNGLNPTCTSTFAPYSFRSSQVMDCFSRVRAARSACCISLDEEIGGHQGEGFVCFGDRFAGLSQWANDTCHARGSLAKTAVT